MGSVPEERCVDQVDAAQRGGRRPRRHSPVAVAEKVMLNGKFPFNSCQIISLWVISSGGTLPAAAGGKPTPASSAMGRTPFQITDGVSGLVRSQAGWVSEGPNCSRRPPALRSPLPQSQRPPGGPGFRSQKDASAGLSPAPPSDWAACQPWTDGRALARLSPVLPPVVAGSRALG